jgi:serine/threonine protein kinase
VSQAAPHRKEAAADSKHLPKKHRKSASKKSLQRFVSMPTQQRGRGVRSSTSSVPATLEKGLWIWDAGIIYSRKGIKFSIYPCRCDMSTVEERGIEICTDLSKKGKVVFARLCRIVQQLLLERFPDLFSMDILLHKHELTQLSICPVCLETSERNPTSFLVESCVHALMDKAVHNCRYHPKSIPLADLVPDYLMVDFPSELHLNQPSFDYNKLKPLHRGKLTSLYEGHIKDSVVAIKVYQHIDGKTITLPLHYIRQELEMLTNLHHPNIVKIWGFSLHPPCVLLERAPLGNLYQKLMDTEQRISRSVRLHIACQVASALNYLHKEGIVYRTLKASSILLWSLDFSDEVSVKLANFERAQFKSPSGLLGKTTFASYPAPEMLRYSFREEYSEKVDVYSFGILLYELVTRWQPFGGIYNTDRIPVSQRPKLSGVVTTGYSTLVQLMEECWQEDATLRPPSSELIQRLSLPAFQCHIATQLLRDCTSVRDCCFVPSVRQVWVYGEYNKESDYGDGDIVEGTQVFILNADTLTIQGTLELKERASALFTVDSKVWIGMTEACVHAYDTTTFRFTDRFKLGDSVTAIADNDGYIFVAQANGHLSCFPKLAQRESQVIDIEIGGKAIIAMITVNDIIWLSCGNELVILNADDDDEVKVEARWIACSPTETIYRLVLSKDYTTVWSTIRGNQSITSWDVHTGEKKLETDLKEEFCWICCELNYDPTYLRLVSVERVQDTLWLGLTCGVIVVLTATEQPHKITYFRAHRNSPKVIMEVPAEEEGGVSDCPMVLTGGFGEVSSVASNGSEQNGVIMSWHALKAEEFKLVVKRYSEYLRSER